MTRPKTNTIAAASPKAMSVRGWPGERTVALVALSLPLLLLSLALLGHSLSGHSLTGPWAN